MQIQVSSDHKKLSIIEYYNIDSINSANLQEYAESSNMYTNHSFCFDWVYDQEATQLEVYENTAKAAVMSTLKVIYSFVLYYNYYL